MTITSTIANGRLKTNEVLIEPKINEAVSNIANDIKLINKPIK